MKTAGLDIADELIIDAENSLEGGREAACTLLGLETRPTAIFCGSDEIAIGCMHEIHEAGLRVPADVSVAGFDDTRYAAVSNPPLTTIRQPAGKMGARLVEKLCLALEDDSQGSGGAEVVPHKLLVRESVGRI